LSVVGATAVGVGLLLVVVVVGVELPHAARSRQSRMEKQRIGRLRGLLKLAPTEVRGERCKINLLMLRIYE
jgi:hypothetical protein